MWALVIHYCILIGPTIQKNVAHPYEYINFVVFEYTQLLVGVSAHTQKLSKLHNLPFVCVCRFRVAASRLL